MSQRTSFLWIYLVFENSAYINLIKIKYFKVLSFSSKAILPFMKKKSLIFSIFKPAEAERIVQ